MPFPGFQLCVWCDACSVILQQDEVATSCISGRIWNRHKLWEFDEMHKQDFRISSKLWLALVFRKAEVTRWDRKLQVVPESQLIVLNERKRYLEMLVWPAGLFLYRTHFLNEGWFFSFFNYYNWTIFWHDHVSAALHCKRKTVYNSQFKSMNTSIRKLNLHNSLTVQ